MTAPIIDMPPLCQTHRWLLVRQCNYGPNDTWRALEIATQLALFQGATADPAVHAQIGGDITKLSTLGCLACRKPDLFGTIVDRVQSTKRAAHIRVIKELGEAWVKAAAK